LGNTGVLKVAASPVQIEAVFSTFLGQYARRYPHVQVKVIEAVGPDVLALLERGAIHVGILLKAVRADDRRFAGHPAPPVEVLAACHPTFDLRLQGAIDITCLASYPLLVLDTGFVIRRTFDAVCNIAKLEPNILIESRAPSNLLALAEAGHGVAIIPSVVLTHRYALRVARITYENKPLREPLSVVWDRRRTLPCYARDFADSLADHMQRQMQPKRPIAAIVRQTKKRQRS
jgi:DNA-binding transcriptional LysR family regulator